MLKILKFIYIFRHCIYMFSVQSSLHHCSFLNFTRFLMGSVFSGSRHFFMLLSKFIKRYMLKCYKSSCSGSLLTQSCLLIPVSNLVVNYLQQHKVQVISQTEECKSSYREIHMATATQIYYTCLYFLI